MRCVAAAVVAIILTLGNAAQHSFNDGSEASTAGYSTTLHGGKSVAALVDSATIDTLQKSSSVTLPLPAEGVNILK